MSSHVGQKATWVMNLSGSRQDMIQQEDFRLAGAVLVRLTLCQFPDLSSFLM